MSCLVLQVQRAKGLAGSRQVRVHGSWHRRVRHSVPCQQRGRTGVQREALKELRRHLHQILRTPACAAWYRKTAAKVRLTCKAALSVWIAAGGTTLSAHVCRHGLTTKHS
jgi:hypothetical protein